MIAKTSRLSAASLRIKLALIIGCGLLLLCGCAYRIPPAASRWITVAGPRYIEQVRAAETRGEIPADLADAYIDEALAVINLTEQVNK